MHTMQDYMTLAARNGASDLHISAGLPPTARINGKLVPLTEYALNADMTQQLAKSIMAPIQQKTFSENGEVDFAYTVEGVSRFRVNVFTQRSTFAITARVLNTRIPTPVELHLPSALVNMCDKKRGLVLVTGATGSGKSTTLASIINEINMRYSKHIITLEDPIEYVHTHNRCIVNQREVGNDTLSFPNALRAALRQDPDVILVGEMRDLETISIAVTAAETGHLVLSTLHTVGAANTIDRIIDVFPPHQQQQIRTQLADVLECVVSQQLIPTASGKGRRAAFEVMLANSAIRNNIREGKTYQIPSAILTNAKMGMRIMDDSLVELCQMGEISPESALAYAQDRATIAKRII